jgi:hypothetical protein
LRRSLFVTIVAALVMVGVTSVLPSASKVESLMTLAIAFIAGIGLYIALMARLRSPELASVGGLIPRRSG